MKKKKLVFGSGDITNLILGIAMIVAAIILFLYSRGNQQLLKTAIIAIGVLLVILGLALGGIFGIVLALILIDVAGFVVERFPFPISMVFLIGGVVEIIIWLVNSPKYSEDIKERNSTRSKDLSGWAAYRNRTPVAMYSFRCSTSDDNMAKNDYRVGEEIDMRLTEKTCYIPYIAYDGRLLSDAPMNEWNLRPETANVARNGGRFFVTEVTPVKDDHYNTVVIGLYRNDH